MNLIKRIFSIIAVIGAVTFTYIIMTATQPAVNQIISTVNSTGNWTSYSETQAAINSFPLWQWGIPGLVGLIAIAGIWLSRSKNVGKQ